MKQIKFTILIALISVIFCGCSKKSTTPPHLVAVPKDAMCVIAFDAKHIVDKAELNNYEQYKMFTFVLEAIENQPAEMRKFIKDFLKDTRVSGLNLDEIFMYMSFNEGDESVGFTFLMDNVKKFEKLLEKADLMLWIDEDRMIVTPSGMKIQWNDKIAVIGVNTGDTDLLNSDEKESILANETFKNAYTNDKDVWMFYDMKLFFDRVFSISEEVGLGQGDLAAFKLIMDFSFTLSFNSEKGSLVAEGKVFPEDKFTELYEKYYKTDFDSELYKYFPDKSFFAIKLAFKPLDAYKNYKEIMGIGVSEEPTGLATEEVEILDDNGKVIDVESIDVDSYRYNLNYNYQMKYFIEQYDEKITSVLSNFTGDFIGSVSSLENIMMPEVAIAAGIVEGKESDVIALMHEMGFEKNSEGYYSASVEFVKVYFAIKKNIAYFALTEDAIAKFLANGYSPNITSAKDFGSELKAANIYSYMNMNINDYPAIVKTFIKNSQGQVLMPLLEKLQSASMRNIGMTGNELKIKFNDKDYGSRTIIKAIDEMVVKYLGLVGR